MIVYFAMSPRLLTSWDPGGIVVKETNYCHMWPDNIFTCNSNGQPDNVTLLTTYCATYDEDTGSVEVGSCIYNEGNIRSKVLIYASLPRNVSELNEFMCGELFNRTGTLCGDCKDGYYPLVYSFDMNCVECPNGNSNWWKFFLAAFFPLTVFFFLQNKRNLVCTVWICVVLSNDI